LDKEIQRIIREIVTNISKSGINLYGESSVTRVEELLRLSQEAKIIIDFMPMGKYKKFGDFLVRAIKNGKYKFFSLIVRNDIKAIRIVVKRNNELKKILEDKYVSRFVIVAGSSTSDDELLKRWKIILKEFKES